MSLFQNKYRIESARMATWDYAADAPYFVTICTKNREHFFGKVTDDVVRLSAIGELANACWRKIPEHFPFVELGEYVIMPNHLHGIVIINKANGAFEASKQHISDKNSARDDRHKVEAQHLASLPRDGGNTINKFGPQSRNLGSVVRGFKAGVVTSAVKNNMECRWQPRFHDHIIRNEDEFRKIQHYILTNPQRWKDDQFY